MYSTKNYVIKDCDDARIKSEKVCLDNMTSYIHYSQFKKKNVAGSSC